MFGFPIHFGDTITDTINWHKAEENLDEFEKLDIKSGSKLENGYYKTRFKIEVNFKRHLISETFVGYADSLSWFGGLFASLSPVL